MSGKPKTFYLPAGSEKQWEQYLELCKSKLNTSGSKRISKLWLDDLAVLEGKEPSALSCSLEQKIAEKSAVEKKENAIKDILEKKKIGHSNAYETLCYLAMHLGTDQTFDKDLPKVRERLIHYQITSKDGFSKSDRQLFVIFIDYVLKRRAMESEIDTYLLSSIASQEIETPVTCQEI